MNRHMALKPFYASLTDVPEAQRELYVERDGKAVLDAEGLVPASEVNELKTKIADYRDTNVQLMRAVGADGLPVADALKKAQEFRARYDGIDPDEYQRLKASQDDLAKRGVTKADDIAALIQTQTEAAIKPVREQLEAEQRARVAAQQQADEARFREVISAEATKHGVRPQSLRHVLREASEKFQLKGGAVVARDGVRHPKEPHQDYTPEAWLQDLSRTDDYLFAASTGGGATNGAPGLKPGAKTLVNPTSEEMGRHMDGIAKGEIVVVRH